MIKYYAYKSEKTNKKYYIITNDNKDFYFGASWYSEFTIHKYETRKIKYLNRHKIMKWLLWHLPTISASYQDIKRIKYIN